jgi:hypothetical protein
VADHLYEVEIEKGRNHPEWEKFYSNVTRLNAKAPDFSGINRMCVLKHHTDNETVKFLCTEGMKHDDDVSVIEITKESLEGKHIVLNELVDSYFRPYGRFVNL